LRLHAADLGVIGILGCWYGLLPAMIEYNKNWFKIKMYLGYDLDNESLNVAKIINPDHHKFICFNMDVNDANFHSMDTIINTSCEHMSDDWFHKIPEGKLVVLQSNNFFDCEGHVNCVKNEDEFVEKYPLKRVLHYDTLELQKYDRFILIGTT